MEYLNEINNVFNNISCNNKINNIEEWNEFLTQLCINKFINSSEINLISEKLLIFPITFNNFLNIVSEFFNFKEEKEIEKSLSQFETQLEEIRNLIIYWKMNNTNKEELKIIINLINNWNNNTNELETNINKIYEIINNLDEKKQQIKDLNINKQLIHTSYEYQNQELSLIEQEYNRIKVKNIHYRNQKVKILKEFKDGILKVIAFDFEKDYPLEVYKIPKIYLNVENLDLLLYKFEALKELIFSKYFLNYLGFNNINDPNYNLYFIEFINLRNLKKLLKKSSHKLHQNILVFKYWSKEIFNGLKDLFEKSTYLFELPIKLSQIYTNKSGLKIIFKDIKFTNKRNKLEDCHEILETKLLNNYGKLLLNLLEFNSFEEFKEKNQDDLKFISFIETLIKCEIDIKKNVEFKIKNRLSFDDISKSQFLKDKDLQNFDIIDFNEEYQEIFT